MEHPQSPTPPLNTLIEQRRSKLDALRAKGIDPFKNKFTPDSKCDEARSKFDKGEVPEGARFSVAGRITAHRDMGKSIFIDVRDQSGRVPSSRGQILTLIHFSRESHWCDGSRNSC